MDRSFKKKLVKLIKRDKFKKVTKMKPDPDAVLIRKTGMTGLHVAAKFGSSDCLHEYLKLGASPLVKDSKNCYPLHYAAKYCLKRFSRGNVSDLVSVLIPYYDETSLREPNAKGTSIKVLLEALNTKQDLMDRKDCYSSYSSESEEEEEEWLQKLQETGEEENYHNFVKFEEVDELDYATAETYDQWADRIYEEYFRKKYPKPPTSTATATTTTTSAPKKVIKKPSSSSALVKEDYIRLRYEKKCKKIFEGDGNLELRDLPFTLKNSHDEITSVIFGRMDVSDKEAMKLKIRKELLRWHPDKFFQKHSHRVVVEESDQKLFKDCVTHISQSLIPKIKEKVM